MSKGITAFMIVVALTSAMSIMAGLGFYNTLNVDYGESADEDVQDAADAMIDQDASDQSSNSVLEDFTTSAGRTLSTGWTVIANLSGILQLLLGVPEELADAIQRFFQIVFSITFAAFIRGVALQ